MFYVFSKQNKKELKIKHVLSGFLVFFVFYFLEQKTVLKNRKQTGLQFFFSFSQCFRNHISE